MGNLLTVEQAAKILGIQVSTLYDWTWRKKIPFYKFSRRCIRFDEKAITDWIEKQAVSVTEPPSPPQGGTCLPTREPTKAKKPRSSGSVFGEQIYRMVERAKKEVSGTHVH